MSKSYRVPPMPPHNEGNTVAAWTLTALVVLGIAIATVGLAIASTVVMIIGGAVTVLGIVAGIGLALAGFGQKRKHSSQA